MDTGGPPRDRRKPLLPRQIILATLAALGVGALLSSAALVGLAERQPLGTQRDVALGAANVTDRVAHLLSLNRPAAELAAALDETEEVYDVEALIARARAAAPEPEPAPPPAVAEEEPTVAADPGETAAEPPAEPGASDPGAGPPGDGFIEPVEGVDCIPEQYAAALDTTDDGTGGPAGEDPPDDGTGGPTGIDPPGGDGPDADDPAAGEPDDESGGTDGESGAPEPSDPAEPAEPTDCPPGFVPAPAAGWTPAAGPAAEDPDPAADTEAPEQPLFDAPRTPDEDRPLAMYVGGDSISRDLGEGLARVSPADLVRIDLDPRPATGLSRPDFFDWAQHLAGVLTESLPDVIVVLFGANDFQNVEHEGVILDRFGDEWLELYRARVDRIMTLLSQPDTQTVWVGQPPVREPRLSGGLERLNTVYEDVAADHPRVSYVDTWALFSDGEGDYADEIDGVRLRREDGVHLTIDGGNRLAAAVWDVIGPAWGVGG